MILKDSAASEQPQYLTFVIGEEEYGIAILRVREILRYEAITPVPLTPPSIRGVINLRGRVVAVIDPAVRFELGHRPVTASTCIVIVEVQVEGEPTIMGLIADSVTQVVELPEEAIQPPPPFGAGVRVEFLLGVGRVDRRFVLLLDVDRLLASQEMSAVAAAQRSEAAAPPVAIG